VALTDRILALAEDEARAALVLLATEYPAEVAGVLDRIAERQPDS
jgi:hypothetical protein